MLPVAHAGGWVYKQGMSEFTDDQNCFVCGKRNQAGLQLEFQLNGRTGESKAPLTFPVRFQGWQETVHGGLLATVLDETLVKAAAAAGHKCVTAEITVKFKKPAPTGAPCLVSGKVLETRGRLILAESRICDEEGQVLAQATGKLFKVE